MFKSLKTTSIAATLGAITLVAVPAGAVDMPSVKGGANNAVTEAFQPSEESWNHKKNKHRSKARYRDDRYYYGDRVHRDTRVWRGNDGRYRCKKDDGTTGLLIGAAVGGLAGNEIAGRGDKTLGALLGAVGGGLLGREIDRSDTRCR